MLETAETARTTLDVLEAQGLWRASEPLRLHLGCGEQHFDGYVNIDLPRHRHEIMTVRPDFEADITSMTMPAASVDEIRLHHVFEHFNRVVALGMLIRWRTWLKDGGLLVVETPDFIATARLAVASAEATRMALIRHLEGDQAAPWAYHVSQWYAERFERTFAALGFRETEVEESSTERWHHVGLRNVTVRARKRGERTVADLAAAADELLRESTLSEAEQTTLETWRGQLRSFLGGAALLEQTTAHPESEPADPRLDPALERFLQTLEARRLSPPPIEEIHAFNELNRHAWVGEQAQLIAQGARLLDVGAGTCPYRGLFVHTRYEAHDFGQYEGYRDKERDEGLYGPMDYISDVTAIPVPDDAFDAVLCTEVLEHVPEPIAAIGELTRLLKPGGVMLLTAPLGSGLHQEPFHFYGGFTPHWYQMVAARFGLDVEEVSPNGGTYRHIAQECARVSWMTTQHRAVHGSATPAVGYLFGELLPRFLTAIDDRVPHARFTVGYHVRLRKR
jgi:SAM-dependent methyltransferase